jgi:threonine/homoserine/homoserine lactone efflux protein
MELLLLPLATFAFVTSITPGPNNIMLASSGINFGFVRTIPHILGVTIGFAVLVALCAVGVGALIVAVPAAYFALKLFGTLYLLFFAWQLRLLAIREDNVIGKNSVAKATPMSFTAAALFQLVNPKAWVMAVTGAALFTPNLQPYLLAVLLLSAVFAGVNLPCITAWALLGAGLRRFLNEPIWQRVFSSCVVMLTVYSAAAIWL